MHATRNVGDLVVAVSQERMPVVVDPQLALGECWSPVLTLKLSTVMEAWLPRSFWHCVDASEVLDRFPQAYVCAHAVSEWAVLRQSGSPGLAGLSWLGDNPESSQCMRQPTASLIAHYEDALDVFWAKLLGPSRFSGDELAGHQALSVESSSMDALALSACLGGVPLLCMASEDRPVAVKLLERAGMAVEMISGDECASIFSEERGMVRAALARAGLAPLLRRAPALAVVRIFNRDIWRRYPAYDSWTNIDMDLADAHLTGDRESGAALSGAYPWWYWVEDMSP
jgi:hypothetical protein